MTTLSNPQTNPSPIAMTTEIVAAFVGNNTLSKTELPELIEKVYATVAKSDGSSNQGETADANVEKPTKHRIRASIKPDGIVSFIDGKPYKTLKRHLARHGTTPEAYRRTWGLPSDYPMVAASYSERRSEIARRNMQGAVQRAQPASETANQPAAEIPAAEPVKRGRRLARKVEAQPAAQSTPMTASGGKTASAPTETKTRQKPGRKPKEAAAETSAPAKESKGKRSHKAEAAPKKTGGRKKRQDTAQPSAHA